MLTLRRTKIVEIFVDCDDFMIDFSESLGCSMLGDQPQPLSGISASEILTICIAYHHSRMDCFKTFYLLLIRKSLSDYFPDAPSYTHFIKLKKNYLFELFAFLLACRMSAPTPDANFIDSKKLQACHSRRQHQHRVMNGLAAKGKTSTGWFYGMKIHLIINQFGHPCQFAVTAGNCSDNNANLLQSLFKGIRGIFFGDKGYLTKLKAWLKMQGVQLVTKVRKNMKKEKLTHKQKHYLKRRSLIETVFGLLTFQCDIDHTRHRSQHGFFINLCSALIAYTYFDAMPQAKRFSRKEIMENDMVLIKD